MNQQSKKISIRVGVGCVLGSLCLVFPVLGQNQACYPPYSQCVFQLKQCASAKMFQANISKKEALDFCLESSYTYKDQSGADHSFSSFVSCLGSIDNFVQ